MVKILIAVVSFIFLIFIGALFFAYLQDRRAEQEAGEICDSISVGSNIHDALKEHVDSGNISIYHKNIETGEFWFSKQGFFVHLVICTIQTSNEIVTSKTLTVDPG